MKSRHNLCLAALALAGCAARAALPPLDPTHPASPDGAEAAIPEPTTALRESPVHVPEEPDPTPHHGHAMHGGTTRTPGGAQVEHGTEYTCPMHPEVRQSKAGRCPKCGMTLVKREGGEQEHAR